MTYSLWVNKFKADGLRFLNVSLRAVTATGLRQAKLLRKKNWEYIHILDERSHDIFDVIFLESAWRWRTELHPSCCRSF
jgi:hypothetical protein